MKNQVKDRSKLNFSLFIKIFKKDLQQSVVNLKTLLNILTKLKSRSFRNLQFTVPLKKKTHESDN